MVEGGYGMWRSVRVAWTAALTLVLSACGTAFPTGSDLPLQNSPLPALDGGEIFERSLQAHTPGAAVPLRSLAISTEGTWPFLVTKIQPRMTDEAWRVTSDEYLDLDARRYDLRSRGPAGTKRVVRTSGEIAVSYNAEPSDDDDVLKATALTTDAMWLFYLGPRGLEGKKYAFMRLADGIEKGRRYYRIHSVVEPGFGYSDRDQLVLWIDPETFLVYRTHITLEGFRNTRGAHVDVTIREYQQVDGEVLPRRLFERVRGPIAIDVHDWWTTSIETNGAPPVWLGHGQ